MVRVGALKILPPVTAIVFPRPLVDIYRIVSEFCEASGKVVFQGVYGRKYSDNAENTDRDAQQREKGSQLVASELGPRLTNTFRKNFKE
jgi:hypothetical protein